MKKTLLLSTFLMLAGSFAISANAQVGADVSKTKEILFKIHDIKPNKDAEGFVRDCNFLVTFYNRTDYEIDSASLDLSWKDNTGNYIIEQNEKEIASQLSTANEIDLEKEKEKKKQEEVQKPKLKAEEKKVSTFIEMPSLSAYTQTTVSGLLKSEKCFLLQEDVMFNVTSCKIRSVASSGDQTFSNSTRERSVESCSRLFKYVSPQDAEYYREFKAISVSDQQKIVESDLEKSLNAIEAKYNNIISNIDGAKGVLSDIK